MVSAIDQIESTDGPTGVAAIEWSDDLRGDVQMRLEIPVRRLQRERPACHAIRSFSSDKSDPFFAYVSVLTRRDSDANSLSIAVQVSRVANGWKVVAEIWNDQTGSTYYGLPEEHLDAGEFRRLEAIVREKARLLGERDRELLAAFDQLVLEEASGA